MHTRIALAILAAACVATTARAQFPDTFIPPPSPNLEGEPETKVPPVETAPAVEGIDATPQVTGAKWWVSSDFLMGWIRGTNMPALVTTSPSGTSQASAGVLGNTPSTSTVLFGQADAGGGFRPGVRVGAGGWLDADHTFGIDGSFFMLGSLNSLFSASSPDGSTILARPFSNAATGVQDSQLISYPGITSGSVTASLRTDNFYSGSVDLTEVAVNSGGMHLETLIGYRFLRFDDRLAIDQTSVSLGTSVVAVGTQIQASDRFTASNVMNGGEAGIRFGFSGENWSVDATGKLGVGMIHTSVGIEGATTISVPGSSSTTLPGGVLALGSNEGVYDHYAVVVAPEADINFGWDYNSHIHFQIGYGFLCWTDVARAANQVNPSVNPNLFPPAVSGATPAAPTFSLNKSDLWINMVNIGVEFRF